MVDQLSINDEEVFVFLNFDVKITQKEIESYLNESIKYLIRKCKLH